jgi:haloacetate dehalogenase
MEYTRVAVRGADYLVGTAGSGRPLLLLHGFPQTHYCWRGVVPGLAEEYRVIALDLRGYGATTAPPGGPEGQGYTKREIANDLVELTGSLAVERLAVERLAVVGHDRGARVAYRLALDHPERVDRLAVLNVVPTLDQFERMGAGPSLGYWTWFLLAQPVPFPERLIAGEREHFLRFVFDSWAEDSTAIEDDAFDAYLDALDDGTIASMCADFRASFFLDQEHDLADRDAGRRIECPLLVITGAAETQLADAADVWRTWATDVRASTVPGGHFNPEEAPNDVASALLSFLRS